MNYGFKKRANLRPENDYSVHCIFPNAEHAEEYRNWEKNKSPALKRLFNVQERLVLYLKYMYCFGYRRIRNVTGIPDRKIRRIFNKAYTIAKYESQGYTKKYSALDFSFKQIKKV